LSTSLEEHTPKSNPGSPFWGLGMRMTKTFSKKKDEKGSQSRTKRDAMLKKKNNRRRRPVMF
jgi:hypothetical protein